MVITLQFLCTFLRRTEPHACSELHNIVLSYPVSLVRKVICKSSLSGILMGQSSLVKTVSGFGSWCQLSFNGITSGLFRGRGVNSQRLVASTGGILVVDFVKRFQKREV